MAASGKVLWQRLSLAFSASESETAAGLRLFREYTHRGYLDACTVDEKALSAGTLVDFYRRLSLLRSTSSPVCRRRDARWMSSSDFQFYQIREAGSFFKALTFLPFLRTDAIVLLPVTRIQEDFPLYPVSHSLLDPDLSDPLLDTLGVSLEDQFRLFLAAAHLIGLKTGYFLSPLIAPDSAVIYRKPEFFKWKKFGRDPELQNDAVDEVRAITASDYIEKGQYNYTAIRQKVYDASLTPVSILNEEDTVCFNFDNEDGREYFADIFLNLQNRYSMDFIYLSLPEGMTPEEARKTVTLVQNPGKGTLRKYTGWIVDHPVLAYEKDFQEITNLFSCAEVLEEDMDEESFHTWFHTLGDLFEMNEGKKIPYSRTVAISSKQHKRFDALRTYFLTRFSGLGAYRRPLLVDSEFLKDSLFRQVQNRIEDVYTRYIEVFRKGRLLKVVADDSYAWWIIRDRGRILIALIALDQREGAGAASSIRIDYSEFVNRSKILTVVEYDFSSAQGSLYLSADNSLVIDGMGDSRFRLFSLQ